jgi:hypothetical protein
MAVQGRAVRGVGAVRSEGTGSAPARCFAAVHVAAAKGSRNPLRPLQPTECIGAAGNVRRVRLLAHHEGPAAPGGAVRRELALHPAEDGQVVSVDAKPVGAVR